MTDKKYGSGRQLQMSYGRRNDGIADYLMHKKNCLTVENAGIACLPQSSVYT